MPDAALPQDQRKHCKCQANVCLENTREQLTLASSADTGWLERILTSSTMGVCLADTCDGTASFVLKMYPLLMGKVLGGISKARLSMRSHLQCDWLALFLCRHAKFQSSLAVTCCHITICGVSCYTSRYPEPSQTSLDSTSNSLDQQPTASCKWCGAAAPTQRCRSLPRRPLTAT